MPENKLKIVVLGMGREGLATLHFLLSGEAGNWAAQAEIILADQKADLGEEVKKLLTENPQIKSFTGENYLEKLVELNLTKTDFLIKTPGINKRLPGVKKLLESGVQLTSATNLFFSLKKGKVIAITGSKGKSTTASLIYETLKMAGKKAELVGNIGRPVLEFLADDQAEKIYVLEISSYQLEDFNGQPDIGVLLGFFPEHMDYHGSEEAYYQAKINLARQVKEGGVLIFNQNSEILKKYLSAIRPELDKKGLHIIPYNNGQNSQLVEMESEWGMEVDGEVLLKESDLLIKGKHNLENLLAVAEIARQFEIGWDILIKAAKAFQPLEHRLELVGEFKKIFFYNDAISTTPESTMAALDALSKKGISTLIVGGMDRGYHFEMLVEKLAELQIKNLILLPDTGSKIAGLIKKRSDYQPYLLEVQNMEECVNKALEVTAAGQICLLSCAAPSYNLFKNFEERGRLFKEAVKKLGQ